MNLTTTGAIQKLFGLFELDANGTIIYSRDFSPLEISAAATTATTLVGRNFFDEVASFKNVEEFRRHFKYFMRGSNARENFIFDCDFDEAVVPVKVKMAQISERESDSNRTKLVIVDIRKI